MPKVSFIIPFSHESGPGDLLAAVNSISAQKAVDIETLVVPDGPVHFQSLPQHVQVLPTPSRPGASFARTSAASVAKGDLLAFVDDDVILDPDWAQSALRTFEDSTVGGVSGNAIVNLKPYGLEFLPRELNWIVGGSYWDCNQPIQTDAAAGMNFCVRRTTFIKVGGYKENLGPFNDRPETASWRRLGAEETELAIRIHLITGEKVLYNPAMKVVHKLTRIQVLPKSLFKRALHVGHNQAYLRWLFHRRWNSFSNRFLLSHLLRTVFKSVLTERSFVETWKLFSLIFVVAIGVTIGYSVGIGEFHSRLPMPIGGHSVLISPEKGTLSW